MVTVAVVTTRPIIIGYDGSELSDRAIDAAARLFTDREIVVVTVWEQDKAWVTIADPATLAMVPIDIRVGNEMERALVETAQGIARQGAERATAAGLKAEPQVVADSVTVAETLVRVAGEHDADAIVIGSHGHLALAEALFGSTTRELLKHSRLPVVVVRQHGD